MVGRAGLDFCISLAFFFFEVVLPQSGVPSLLLPDLSSSDVLFFISESISLLDDLVADPLLRPDALRLFCGIVIGGVMRM